MRLIPSLSTLLLSATLLAPFATLAAPLSIDIIDSTRDARPGTVERFSGTISNDSGADLSTADLFFSFFNIFDPAELSLVQLLGLPELLIPNGSRSPVLELFDAELAPTAAIGAQYLADLVLQSVNGDISAPSTVRLNVVPLPATLALGMLALILLPLTMRSDPRRLRPNANA